MNFNFQDKDIRLIGEGGNSRIYLLEREYAGRPSAVIKVPKAFVDRSVTRAIENYALLRQHGIKSMAFLEECMFDGQRALITENLHHVDYTHLDANAHLQSEADKFLRLIDKDHAAHHNEKEPEEERWFADNKFERITNLEEILKEQLAFLRSVSEVHVYLAYDSYYFKVMRDKVTSLDYMIADLDDIQICDEPDLYELNKDGFVSAVKQFIQRYVSEEVAEEYYNVVDSCI